MAEPFGYTFSDKTPEILDKLDRAKSFAEKAADDFIETIHNFFDTGQASGRVWEQPKLRKGMPLVDSGSLRDSFVKIPIDESEYEVISTHKAAPFMEYGVNIKGNKKMSAAQRAKLFGFIIPKDMYDVGKLKGTNMIKVPERSFFRPAFDIIEYRYRQFVKSEGL